MTNEEREQRIESNRERGGWKRYLFNWLFNRIALDQYTGWDTDERGNPPFVMLEHIRGEKESDVESRKIAIEFDDTVSGLFSYRDWTSDGIPFVSTGETYWSGWWFQFREDAEKFQQTYGGYGTWQPEYPEWEKSCRERRSGEVA